MTKKTQLLIEILAVGFGFGVAFYYYLPMNFSWKWVGALGILFGFICALTPLVKRYLQEK